jgi:hypothetical protein
MAISSSDYQEANSYEQFIAALSVFSLVNIVLALLPRQPDVHTVIVIVDTSLCLVFRGDFFSRLLRASDKSAYLVRRGG